jgi:hypothetical protein
MNTVASRKKNKGSIKKSAFADFLHRQKHVENTSALYCIGQKRPENTSALYCIGQKRPENTSAVYCIGQKRPENTAALYCIGQKRFFLIINKFYHEQNDFFSIDFFFSRRFAFVFVQRQERRIDRQ